MTELLEESTAAATAPTVALQAAAPAKKPTTQWGKWITEAVENFNKELEMLAGPEPGGFKTLNHVRPQQVANSLMSMAIERGIIDESRIIKANGRRDPAKVRAMLDALWKDESAWIIEETGGYLGRKLLELLPKQADDQAASDEADDDGPASEEGTE